MLQTEQFLNGIQSALGIPKTLVSRDFIAYLEEFMQDHEIEKSPLHELLDGDRPGVPRPLEVSHPGWMLAYERGLFVYDVLHTLAKFSEDETRFSKVFK